MHTNRAPEQDTRTGHTNRTHEQDTRTGHTNRTHEQGIQRKGSEGVIGHNLRGARGWGVISKAQIAALMGPWFRPI